ncbi:MAG: hypothetical protein ACYTGG_12340, partial [Planctomycetota bacterium]
MTIITRLDARAAGPARRMWILAWAAGLIVLLAAAPPTPTAGEAWEILEERPGQGEQCLVCGMRVTDENVVEIRYRGRTFHVGASRLDEFRADPGRYFAQLQSRTALFNEDAMRGDQMSTGWLWFGFYALAGLVCAAACGYIAICRALPPVPWFLAGLLVNVIAVGVLLSRPRGDATGLPAGIPPGLRKVPRTRRPVACEACGESNHPAAAHCS